MHNARDISRQVWHSFWGGGRAGGYSLVWLCWNRREGGEFALQTPPTAVKTKAGYKGEFINVILQYLIGIFLPWYIIFPSNNLWNISPIWIELSLNKKAPPPCPPRVPNVNYRWPLQLLCIGPAGEIFSTRENSVNVEHMDMGDAVLQGCRSRRGGGAGCQGPPDIERSV